MRAFLFVLLLTAQTSSTAESAAPKTYRFPQIVEAIRTRSLALRIARKQIDVADSRVDMAWTGWQPKLDALGQLTINSVTAELDPADFLPPDLPVMIDPGEPTVIQPAVQLMGALKLNQTLFNITALRAPRAAKAARAAVVADADALEDELLFNAATLYATAVGLGGLEEASVRALEVAQRRIADARIQVEAGTQTPLAITRAEADRARAEGQRISVRSQKIQLLAQLAVLLGEEGPVDVEPEVLSTYYASEAPGPAARSSVAARAQAVQAAELQVDLHDMDWLPSLVAEGSLLYQNFDGFAGTPFLAQAVVSLVWPIYDRGVRYAQTRAARAQLEIARLALSHEKLSVRAYLVSARAAVDAAEGELAQAEAQLSFAAESVQQAENLFHAGLATSLDLADVDSRRLQADRLVAQKRLALELARLQLHYALGGRLHHDDT